MNKDEQTKIIKACHVDATVVWVPAPLQRGRVWRNACIQTVPACGM